MRCCPYSGTDDCAPCTLPRWQWKCYSKPSVSEKRNPQKRWISAMIKVWMNQPPKSS